MAATTLPARRSKSLTLRQLEQRDFYIAISLWLIGLIFFTGGPVVASLFFSLTDLTGSNMNSGGFSWIGLANYWELLTRDPLFLEASINTFLYSFGAVTLGTLGALFVAILLNQQLPGTTALRVAYYMPSIASGVAVSILWIWLLNPQVGLINYFLSLIGIKGPLWLNSQDWALAGLIIKSVWGIGSNMVILLAGLQGIPITLYEAARIDGASWWQETKAVTLPMLSPVLFYVIVISTIASLQILTDVLVMTNGGPGTSTVVYVFMIYKNAFVYSKMGYASALAWVLFAIILALTLAQLWASRRWVYYEAEERN